MDCRYFWMVSLWKSDQTVLRLRRIAFLFQIPFLFFSGVMIYLKVRLVHKPTSAPGSGSATPLPTSANQAGKPSVWSTLRRIDSLGSLLLVTTVGSLLLALSFKTASTDARELAWSDPQVWSLLVTSAVGFILFIFVEGWIAPEPVLPLRLLKRRTPVAVAISNFSMSVSTFSVVGCACGCFELVLIASCTICQCTSVLSSSAQLVMQART